MNNRRILLLGFGILILCFFADSAFCVTDANIKEAYTAVSTRGANLTNVVVLCD